MNARRTLLRGLGLGATLAGLVGCVSFGQHQEVRQALEQERAAHQSTAAALSAAEAEAARARAAAASAASALHAREDQLDELDRSLSGAELAADNLAAQRGEQSLLVDQLRAELGRVGEHLQQLARERAELGAQAAAARARADALTEVAAIADARALLVRDLALALHAPLAAGEVELLLVDGDPAVRMPVEHVYVASGEALQPDAERVLGSAVRVAREHAVELLSVTEVGARAAEPDSIVASRLERVTGTLARLGVTPERLAVEVPARAGETELANLLGTAPPPEVLELRFRVAPGSATPSQSGDPARATDRPPSTASSTPVT